MQAAAQTRESKHRPQTVARSRPQDCRAREKEKGYVLLTLLLIVSLMFIVVTLAIVTPIKFEMQRDREQEMIHRGVQYTRAVRGYYKKFGRYPTRLEDLDNTNNLRYLRKHYKDPLNKNQDFRLLHFGEQGVTLGGSFGGGVIPGATAVGAPNGLNAAGASSAGFGGGSGFGNSGSGFGNSSSGFGNNSGSAFGSNSGVNSSGVFAQGNSNGGSGSNSNSQTPGQAGTNQPGGQDPSQSGSQTPGTGQGNASSSGQQPIASGPIVGVASVSKDLTIRLFNKKTKYNEWQFIYDPTLDRGGLITTPYQQSLQNFSMQPGQNPLAQSPQPGSATGNSSSPFGNNSSFGNSSSYGNSSSPGGSTPPTQPPANQQPQ